ncbi:MAG: PEP-CTERM sorting domain-containing protein [Desulfobulbaceae bacterium]|nr:PEP-CTERM sorting domain-containing protein [Desulfobulbaceae bacterium]
MKKALLAGLAVGVMMLGMTGVASATVLDFEGLTTNSVEDLSSHQGYGGFTWDNGWFLYNNNSFAAPVHSGDYAIVNNYGGDPLGLAITSTTSFDFDGAWIGGWGFNAPSQVKAQGFDNLGNFIGETDWMAVSVGGSSFLQADIDNVYRINFIGGSYYTIDDFTFNEEQQSVPEPATLLLLGTGLTGLIGARRKKKA